MRDLFKYEVRELGVALGLPHDIVHRYPFPGPGLRVRILGEGKTEYAALLRQVDANFHRRPAQCQRRGQRQDLVRPNERILRHLPTGEKTRCHGQRPYLRIRGGLRAVQTCDFMTAGWAELPYALLKKVSSRIIYEVRGINRVTYDVSSKPAATLEWE